MSRYRLLHRLGRSPTWLALDTKPFPSMQCVVQQHGFRLNGDDCGLGPLLETVSQHPQLPALRDWFTLEGESYWVWEFLPGRNLATKLAEMGCFTVAQISQLLAEVLPVLQWLHDRGIVHARLKPSSLIDRAPVALVDFRGMQLINGTRSSVSPSPEYAAPEQLQGQATPASDLYSLGVICLHLLTDLRPFDLRDGTGQWAWQAYWIPGDRDPASPQQRQVLAHLLERLAAPLPTERFPSAAVALEELARSGLLPTPRPHPTIAPPAPVPQQAPTWRCVACLEGHSGLFATVNTIAVSPDGSTIASGSDDKTIGLWSSAGDRLGQLIGHTGAVRSLAFSPDGQVLVSGSSDRTLKFWDIASQSLVRSTDAHAQAVNAVQFSPDGHILASGSADKTVKLWDLATQTEIAALTGHRLAVTAIAFCPTAPLLASASLDSTIRLWDLSTHQSIATLTDHTRAVRTIAFSPDGQHLASGGDDNTIRLWDLTTRRSITLPGHAWTVTALVFTADNRLISGSWDKTLKIWDLSDGSVTLREQHTDSVNAIALSSDGKTIVSGGKDKTLCLWEDGWMSQA